VSNSCTPTDISVDLGEAFTYTGSGGRNLKGTKNAPKNLRTAPQTSNQSFDHRYNAALKRSAETGKPVRVIRGFKNPGKYAPAEGYRYDGLYTVERAWLAKGLTCGLLVCRYALKRVPGQPPLRERSEDGDGENEHEDEEKVDKGLGEAEALVDQSPSPSPARNEHIDVKVRGRSGEPYVEIISRQRPPLDTSDAPCRGRPKRLDESTAKRPRKSSPAPSDEPLEATGKRPRRHTRTSVPAPGEAENSAHPPRRGRPRKTMPLPEPERPRRRAPRCSAR
jgi:E3 ubiquitin-protein ligase UHRF1